MKPLLLLLLTGCCLAAHAQHDSVLYEKQPTANHVLAARLQPLKGEKQYLTAELIRIQGIARLSELFTWIDKTTFSTIQHDRFYLNMNGTASFQEQSYLVMINGQKIEAERWDALFFNQLGIAITDIAYVEITTSPQIINGQFAGKGAINIVTRTDHKGLTASAYNNYGNPVGDPGPAAYINNYTSPNIHKTGLVLGYTLGYYGKKGHINASYNMEDWFLRDTAAINRLEKYGRRIEKIATHAGRVEGALQAGKYLLEAGGALSTNNGFVYRNYFQSEVPANITYSEARLRVTRVLKNNTYIRSNIVVNANDFQHPDTFLANYTYTTFSANAEYGRKYMLSKNRVFKHASGYSLDYRKYSTGPGYQLQHKPYATFTYYPTKKITQQLDVSLNIFNNTVNPAISFKREKNSSIINGSSYIISYQQNRLSSQYDQLWHAYGTNRGAPAAAYPASFNNTPTHLFTADYFYMVSSGGSFKINFNPGIRYQYNYHFIQLDNHATFPLVGKNTSGQTASFYTLTFGTNVHYDVFNNFWFDIDYYSANDQSRNKELQQVLNSDARRKLSVSFYLKLPARIDIGLRSQTVSKTNWVYFNENGDRVSTTLPSVFTTDLSLNKKLWGEHVQLNATIRNLFNQREQYHPIGADYQMRFFVTAIIKFDDLLKYIPKTRSRG